MNEFLILFILKNKKSNIYEIIKFIDKNFAPFMQVSSGAIIPTLKKLEQNEIIKSEKFISDGGLRRTIYTILPKGEDYFNQLLKEPIVAAPQLLRRDIELFLMILNNDILSLEQNTLLIEKTKNAINNNIKTIETLIKNKTMNVEFLEQELKNMKEKKQILDKNI